MRVGRLTACHEHQIVTRDEQEAGEHMTRIRTVVVEDHTVARERLVEMLGAEPDVDVVASCASGNEAVAAIRKFLPNLVLLDLQMPDLDGFGIIAALGDAMPLTIFVTAYDEYALKAFEVHAFDYLLKPFGRDRFQRAVARARTRLSEGLEEQLARRFVSLVADAGSSPGAGGRLMVKSGGRVMLLPLDELDAIESEGNYVRLHTGGRSYLVRDTMAGIEARLESDRFCRIHRGWIVNLDRVREVATRPNGEHELVMRDGRRIRVGRAYREAVQARLKGDTGTD
jgi:two-component system LytT family response regulator